MSRPQRALVLGAGGQVGVDLLLELLAANADVIPVDQLPAESTNAYKKLTQLAPNDSWSPNWEQVDVTDAAAVADLVARTRPDVIYHLAAVLSAAGEAHTGLCWTINVDGRRNVLDAIVGLQDRPPNAIRSDRGDDERGANAASPTLVWPSSIAAFGLPPGAASSADGYTATEEWPFFPITMYGVTKVAGEKLGEYYARRSKVDFRSIRFPGLISSVEPSGGSSDYANEMYFRASHAEPAECFVQRQARIPFMHMDDAISALLQLAAADRDRLTHSTYNITAFPAPSAMEMVASIQRRMLDFCVTYEPDGREVNVLSWPNELDDSAARTDWGWLPEIDSLDNMTDKLLAEFSAARR